MESIRDLKITQTRNVFLILLVVIYRTGSTCVLSEQKKNENFRRTCSIVRASYILLNTVRIAFLLIKGVCIYIDIYIGIFEVLFKIIAIVLRCHSCM